MRRTPQHQYQILTKRPDNIMPTLIRLGLSEMPGNVWIGSTVEDHRVVDRIDYLRAVPAPIRFLSVEPLTATLGDIDLTDIHWVIVGGESGPGARPCREEWVRDIIRQCHDAGTPVFFKQWGRPQFNPLANSFPRHAKPGEALKDFIKRLDPHGKGGALVGGKLYREMPAI